MASAAVRPGGWIALDDIAHAKYPGVGLAWREIVCRAVPAENRVEHRLVGFAQIGRGRVT